jgi:hypothetical protein
VGNPRRGERRAGAGAARERERHSEAERAARVSVWFGASGWEVGRIWGGWSAGPREAVDWLTILPLT